MNLEKTKNLLVSSPAESPAEELISILEAAAELASLPESDFTYSTWLTDAEALAELRTIMDELKVNGTCKQGKVAVLFAPTGPLQELSLGSGWSDTFLKLAERFDAVEKRLWQ